MDDDEDIAAMYLGRKAAAKDAAAARSDTGGDATRNASQDDELLVAEPLVQSCPWPICIFLLDVQRNLNNLLNPGTTTPAFQSVQDEEPEQRNGRGGQQPRVAVAADRTVSAPPPSSGTQVHLATLHHNKQQIGCVFVNTGLSSVERALQQMCLPVVCCAGDRAVQCSVSPGFPIPCA